jgi:hypothetical protein
MGLCIYLIYPLTTAMAAFSLLFFHYDWYLAFCRRDGLYSQRFIMQLDVVNGLWFFCVCALAALPCVAVGLLRGQTFEKKTNCAMAQL